MANGEEEAKEDEEMAANDSRNGKGTPTQSKAAPSAKVLPPMNQGSIELNDNDDEVRADEQGEANHCQ